MRKRNTQLNIRLTKEELQRLKENAAKANYSVSNYLRTLINGISPKACPPIEYHFMMEELEQSLGKLEQIMYHMPDIFHGEKEDIYLQKYIEALNEEVFALYEVVDMIREAVQLPEVVALKDFPGLLEPRRL